MSLSILGAMEAKLTRVPEVMRKLSTGKLRLPMPPDVRFRTVNSESHSALSAPRYLNIVG